MLDLPLSASSFYLVCPVFFKTDRPAPPSNVTLLSLEPFTVSWVPPFTLPGVTLSYIAIVTNLNTSRVIRSGELWAPSFNFSGTVDGSPCDVYRFTVTANNAAGRSDPSNFNFSLPSCKLHLKSIQNVTSHIPPLEIQKSCMYNKHEDHTIVLCV